MIQTSLASPGFLLAQCLLVGIGVKLPLSSPIRGIIPLLTLPLAYYQYISAPYFTTSNFYNSGFGSLCLSAWVLSVKTFWELNIVDTFSHGFNFPINSRGIETPFRVKNLPSFPKYYGGTPSRAQYIARQSCFVALAYLALDLILMGDRNMPYEDKLDIFGNGQEFQFFSLPVEKRALRFVVSNITWFVGARIMLGGLVVFYQLVMVIFGGNPANYPPMFGSMWDVYSVRQFWGKFWHQSLRVPLTTVSNFVARKMLQLPRPSILERYTNILLAFTGSGILHVAHAHVLGTANPLGTMMFFQSQAIAIMIEDGVQELWRQFQGIQADGGIPLWRRAFGFLWVMFVFGITSPWYSYPENLTHDENWWVLPYSFVDSFGIAPVGTAVGVGAIVASVVFKPEI